MAWCLSLSNPSAHENISSRKAEIAITCASAAALARLETRPPVLGGRKGGRVSRAACPANSGRAPGEGGRAGGGRPYRVWQAGRSAVFGLVLPGDGPKRGQPGWRGARRASPGSLIDVRWHRIQMRKYQILLHKMQHLSGSTNAGGRRIFPAAACWLNGLIRLSWPRWPARGALRRRPRARPRRGRRCELR